MRTLLGLALVVFIIFSCGKAIKEPEKNYLFKIVPQNTSQIDFVNEIREDVKHNIINYIYYYNGGGVAVGDIDNDGLTDVFFVSNQGENKLFLNKGNLKFQDISSSSGISGKSSWNTGVTMIDINADGYLDIYVCAVTGLLDFSGHNELFINNGNGTFSEQSKEYGLDFKGFSTQSYFFDYDKDDDLDVYIVNHAIHTTLSHGSAIARNKRVPLVGDVLYENVDGKFIDVSEKANIYGGVNGYGLSASIADLNNDGWEDIYVCNDFHEDDYYYINQKDGSFKEDLESSFSTISRFSMGSDTGDVNNDGYLDLITLDMLPSDERVVKESEGDDAMYNMSAYLSAQGYKDQYSRNMLQLNSSGKYFFESAIFNGVSNTDWSWSALIADFNNDSHQDLFITTGILRRPNNLDFKQFVSSALRKGGSEKITEWLYKSIDQMPNGSFPNQIFQGNSKKFKNRNGEWIENIPTLSNGATYVDLDNDGDLDLITNNLNSPASIFENTTSKEKKYISFQLNYKGKNLEGIGSKISVYTKNKEQTKNLTKSRGFLSSVESSMHFGLGLDAEIDSVRIVWPNMDIQTIVDIPINQKVSIDYFSEAIFKNVNRSKNKKNTYFTNTNLIEYTHLEDLYRDSDLQPLIPYSVSMQSPSMGVADVDKNGYQDVLIGSAAGFKTSFFSNNGESLVKTSIVAVENDSLYEDNYIHFFDADNDGDKDLYIASGVTSSVNRAYYRDRLYINNNGNFIKSQNRIPVNELNTSVVISSDYDLDGDIDLFIGNLSNASDFGLPVESFLLKNDGKGNFSKDVNFILSTRVNDAVWEDINEDGTDDLLIAADWEKPIIFRNLSGNLKNIQVPESLNGLWQTIAVFDIDGDEDEDIVLGNWGLNTKFSQHSLPLFMYYNDFDNNGSFEVLLAYQIEGEHYPLNSKDELTTQMKSINKKFLSYKDFSFKTVEELFGIDKIQKSRTYVVEELASGYLENDKGDFKKFHEFKDELQMAPINSFTKLKIENGQGLLVSGNSLKVNSYHGGYTSLKGMIVMDTANINSVSELGMEPFETQISTIGTIPMRDKNLVLILSNNGKSKTYFYKKE